MVLIKPFKDPQGTEWHFELAVHSRRGRLKLEELDALLTEGSEDVIKNGKVARAKPQIRSYFEQSQKTGVPIYTLELDNGRIQFAKLLQRVSTVSLPAFSAAKAAIAYGSFTPILGKVYGALTLLGGMPIALAGIGQIKLGKPDEVVSKEKVLNKFRKVIGAASFDPSIGLTNATMIAKAKKIAQQLREKGIKDPKIGITIGRMHFYSLAHMDDENITSRFKKAYGRLLDLDSEIGSAYKITHDGKKWNSERVELK